MAGYPLREGDYTFEEFCDVIPDGQKADLLDGVIYMASPDNTTAADLLVWLSIVVSGFVEVKDLGKVYLSRVAYRLGSKRARSRILDSYPTIWRLADAAALSRPPPWPSRSSVRTVFSAIMSRSGPFTNRLGCANTGSSTRMKKARTFLGLQRGRYKKISPSNTSSAARYYRGSTSTSVGSGRLRDREPTTFSKNFSRKTGVREDEALAVRAHLAAETSRPSFQSLFRSSALPQRPPPAPAPPAARRTAGKSPTPRDRAAWRSFVQFGIQQTSSYRPGGT